MSWLFYSILCATSEALKDLVSKRGLKKIDPLTVSWAFFVLTTIFISPLNFQKEIPPLTLTYWACLLTHGTIFGITVYLYMKAISLSELSSTIPLIMLTPLFMLFTAPILIGEWPSKAGLTGTLLIVLGSYLLNISSVREGAFKPFKALLKEKGARLMLLVAFLWSLTSVVDKIGVKHSSPIFWGFSLYLFISFYLTFALIIRKKFNIKKLVSYWKFLLPVGIFNSLQLIGYLYALESGPAVYVLSMKRTSVLIVLVLGSFFYKELNLRERLLGSMIMFLGILCISFA